MVPEIAAAVARHLGPRHAIDNCSSGRGLATQCLTEDWGTKSFSNLVGVGPGFGFSLMVVVHMSLHSSVVCLIRRLNAMSRRKVRRISSPKYPVFVL